jgi:hypothetical protein
MMTVCFAVALQGAGEAQDKAKTPPCSEAEYAQFDFWIGEWRVTDPKGVFQGTNRIEKILGGCALQENWDGAQGMRGHSYNAYAKRRDVWHQTWVDSNGTLLLLEGRFKDGRMVLRGDTPGPEGKGTVNHEISWERLSGGRVRQIWRMSRDGGSSWSDAFVGLYTRQE